jgi:chloramphenicol O-acetyltransferase
LKHWHPIAVQLQLLEAEEVVSLLSALYEKNAHAFFQQYGSEIEMIALAKALSQRYRREMNLARISPWLKQGGEVANMIGVTDSRL